MFFFKKHSQKDKIIKRSKKRTTIIASVVIVFVVAIALILSLSLRYYPSPGYKYMKHEIGSKNVARSNKIQKRILKDGSEHVGIMFDARDDVSDHAFYGTEADATKKKEQKKAIKEHKSEGWAEYIKGSKKDNSESWYYVDTARNKGANHYNTKGEAIEDFLVSNKNENSLWFDPYEDGDTTITGNIPVLYARNDEEDLDLDSTDDLPSVQFEFLLKEETEPQSNTIEPTKKDKTSAGDEELFFTYNNPDAESTGEILGVPTQVSTYDNLKTSWWYFEKTADGNYRPQLIVYGLEIENNEPSEGETEGTIKPYEGSVKFWEDVEYAAWNSPA